MVNRLRSGWPYVLLLLLCLPALWPLWQAGLPRSNDHLPHLYRALQLAELLRAGVWLPRWAPDLAFGYGYPVFNFFPYLAHLLIAGLHLLGPDLLTAYKLITAATIVGSAWAAFMFARELWGEAGGLAAGVAYAYSPYVLYDVHIRGSVPETLALMLMPLALRHLRRAARDGSPHSVAWAALAIAGCLLAHNGVSLQALPFLGLYGLAEAWQAGRWRAPGWYGAFGLALLLSAFFWLPALAESPLVQIERGTLNGGMLYTENFLSLGELLAYPRLPVDPDLLNPPVVRALPAAALILAGLAVLRRWPTAPRPERLGLAFLALAAGVASVLIHPISRPLWEALPLLRLTLFPWRLLGPISLFVAVLAGALFTSNRPGWALPLALTGLVIAGLPFASPPVEPLPAPLTLAGLAAFEIPPDFIGTTTVGEYLPDTVQQLPADAANRRGLEARQRFTAPGAEVIEAVRTPLRAEFEVTARQPVAFTFQHFFFPGWTATLDGQPLPVQVTAPEGLMQATVPVGTHRLVFAFGSTPVRDLGQALSLAGVLITAALLWRPRPRPITAPSLARLTPRALGGLGLLAVALATARPLLYDPGRTPLLQRGLSPAGLRGVAMPLRHNFADELWLLGWDLGGAPTTLTADTTFTLNLYWQAARPLGVPYGVDVKVVDDAGRVWSAPEMPRPRDWRFTPGTDQWPTDQYVLDPRRITLLPGTPPGVYALQVDVFSLYDLRSLGKTRLGPLTVAAASRRPCAQTSLAEWGARRLQAATASAERATGGDELVLTLCWAIAEPVPALSDAELLLVDAAGRPAQRWPLSAPAGAWAAGDVVRGQWPVRLRADLPAGAYHWAASAAGHTTAFGALTVTAPERTFTAPALGRVLAAGLGPATLYALAAPEAAQPGAALPVTVVWRAEAPWDASYHVFVHLLTAEGVVAAQSDGVPAGGARATPSWLPGEYIVDARTVALPPDLAPGRYTLSVGLYHPETGERLRTAAFPEGMVLAQTVSVP